MKLTSVAINAAMLILTACGGGGDTPPRLAAQRSQMTSGVTAIGTALPGATVNVTRSAGSGTATTRADDSYPAPIMGASLPYVVTAASSDGKTALHSLVTNSGSVGSTAMINTTPLTELLLAQLAGQDPAKYMAGFGSMTTVSASGVTAVRVALIKALQSAGFDASGIGDSLDSTFSTGGDQGYGGVLSTLQPKLAGVGITLINLSTAVASTNDSSSGSTGSTAGIALAPANPACPVLKSGDHRLIKFLGGSAQVVTIDTAKLTVTVDGSSCQLAQGVTTYDYTLNDISLTRALVAKSGMVVWTSGSDGTGILSLSLPKQTVDPTAVSGNYIYALPSGAGQGALGTNNYVKGVVTVITNCAINVPCAPDLNSPYGHMIATSDGGVDWVDGSASVGTINVYAHRFRNAQGNTIFVVTLTGGGVGIFAPQATLSTPAVGMTNTFWQSNIKSTDLSAVTENSNIITAVNGSTVTHTFVDTHTNQIIYNDSFTGLRHRPGTKVCTNTSGVTITCNETWQLPLNGPMLALSGSPPVTLSTYQVNFLANKPGN